MSAASSPTSPAPATPPIPPKGNRYDPADLWTPANIVTLLRVAAAPLAFWMMHATENSSSWPLAFVWFALSSSDYLDGTLARRHGPTRAGAFLDPLADKVLVWGGVGVMCLEGRFPWIAWVLIVGRDLAVSVFRSYYARRGLAVPASKLAKWKAFLQLAAVGWVTLPWTNEELWLADVTLWIGIAAGIVSGAQYFRDGSRAATTMAR
ncbi:MAG: CDP-alcohol phosphatidyltransferase family protein [Microthrixaceae bacterium]|nr:CDP-alcohol phosphatidyltransferase family protein [Microthrixaceae bacterium]MCO5312717.1 CDP-alcohol phosphatidyltransferase family protein [Microthrixaceae bacterium]